MCDPILPPTKIRGEIIPTNKKFVKCRRGISRLSFFFFRTLGAGVTPAAHRAGD
jgi:hypothetical protein